MKIRELADYCKSIELNCDECMHKKKCDNMQNMLEDISPLGIVDMVDENEDIEDELMVISFAVVKGKL